MGMGLFNSATKTADKRCGALDGMAGEETGLVVAADPRKREW